MLGWSIRASACRSASKRAMTCFVSMPGLMILSATLRRIGCALLGHVNDAHAPLADLFQQLVGADDRAGPLGEENGTDGGSDRGLNWLQERSCLLVSLQEFLDTPAQKPISAARLVEERCLLNRIAPFQGFDEERLFPHRGDP